MNKPLPNNLAPGSSLGTAPESFQGRLDDLSEMIGVYSEVTEKLQRSHEVLNAEVLRLRERLAHADVQLQRAKRLAALGEMAAGIAHEIRNPLAAIQLYARMIGQDLTLASPNTLVAGENAEKIAQAVRGLNAIVEDVLTFSRELRPRRSAIDAVEVIERAIAAHHPAIEDAGVEVVVAGENILLDVDGELIHQALLNLIRNAVDAMSEHDGVRRLTLEASRGEGDVRLTVSDTGPGIREADVDRLFNPFFTTRNTGTGLGLAIVHRILDVHEGAIGVHNAGGAVFTLSLPLVAGHGEATKTLVSSGVVA